MESTSPTQPNGLYRILLSTAAQQTFHRLPTDSSETSAGIVLKLIETQLYKILLLHVQRSILVKTETPLKPGQIIQLVRDKSGAYRTAKPVSLPLEVINQSLRHTLPIQRPLSKLLNRWLSPNFTKQVSPSSPGRQAIVQVNVQVNVQARVPAGVQAKVPAEVPANQFNRGSSDNWVQLARLIREIPPKEQLQRPASLRRQILNNGIFHEFIDKFGKTTGSNLKGSLIQLQQWIERSIGSKSAGRPSGDARQPNSITIPTNATQTSATTEQGKTQTASTEPAKIQTAFTEQGKTQTATTEQGKTQTATTEPGKTQTATTEQGKTQTSATEPGKLVPGLPLRRFFPARSFPDMQEQPAKNQNVSNMGQTEQAGQIPPTQLSKLKSLLLQVHQAIARIQALQLQSLNQQQASRESNQWFIEIPARSDDHIDVFSLQIKEELLRHKKADDEDEPRQAPTASKQLKKWTIKLEFDLPGLGPMAANLTIIDKSVSLSIWAEQRSTYEISMAHLGQLESKLRGWQLDLDQISCHRGSNRSDGAGPYSATGENRTAANMFQFSNLIDLKT